MAFLCRVYHHGTGQNGGLVCDSFLENVTDPTGFNAMGGLGPRPLDTTVANDIELTTVVTSHGQFQLLQCSIEYLPTP